MCIRDSISAKQQKVLDFLRQYNKENGYYTSVRDICEGLWFSSTSTVHGYLCRLEERGLIRRYSFRPRTIEIVDDANILRETVSLPVIGRVAAGQPIFAEENIEAVSYTHLAPLPYQLRPERFKAQHRSFPCCRPNGG